MAGYLNFDTDGFLKGYMDMLTQLADSMMIEMLNEMNSNLKGEAQGDNFINNATAVGTIIYGSVQNNVLAVLDSYGTGSKLDIGNDYLDIYQGSDLWNKLRNTTTNYIVGREKGTYIDIFGRVSTSTGALAGMNLEEIFGSDLARSPSYAIQNAESLFFKQRVDKYIAEQTATWITKNANKYFEFKTS